MKKLIYIFLIIFSFTACDSLVQEEVFSSVTPNNFFNSERDIATAVNGVYDGIQDLNLYYIMLYMSEMTPGSMAHFWSPIYETLAIDDNAGEVWTPWKKNYDAIGRANSVLAALENSSIDDAVKNQYMGEVRFIRAYCYFNLVRIYGHLPLVTKVPESISEAVLPDTTKADAYNSEYLKQVDRDEIYQFIIDDLKFAEENLPVSYDDANKGRATSGSASGMLARVYLTQAGKQYDYTSGNLVDGDPSKYDMAAQKCQQVISTGSYRLLPNFADIFENSNDNNDEILFSIQYLESAVAGVTGEGGQTVARMGIRGANITPYAWKQCYCNMPFYEDWVEQNTVDDSRYDMTFLTEYVNAKGKTVKYGSGNFIAPHVRKFLSDMDYPNISAQNATDYGDNPIVMRYADILLMQSEALNEKGSAPDENTINGINQVRARAGKTLITLPISKEQLREEIWNERKWELAYEGVYYFDCQRTGRLLDEIAKYQHNGRLVPATGKLYIMPIPYNAMQANPSLKQNAGW